MKQFFRVGNIETEQGLWYDTEGRFTGLIHDKFDFCQHNKLKMDFDSELTGFMSAVDSFEGLFSWFPIKDMEKLHKVNYRVHIYETSNFKFYERFQHDVINQKESKLIKVLTPEEYLKYTK